MADFQSASRRAQRSRNARLEAELIGCATKRRNPKSRPTSEVVEYFVESLPRHYFVEVFGSKSRFAAEVGEFWGGSTQLRRVDLWGADQHLTCDDNIVYVPQFLGAIQETIQQLDIHGFAALRIPPASPEGIHLWLAENDGRWDHRFPTWGPTTDNLEGYLVRAEDHFLFTFRFWRETTSPDIRATVFHTSFVVTELRAVLEHIASALIQTDEL